MLYVYAIADDAPEQLGAGLHGSPLLAVSDAGLVGVASSHGRVPTAGVEEMWRHDQVVEEMMASTTVLPLRFGTTVADEAGLRALLASRAEEFRQLLEAVRGAVELSVRVQYQLPEATPTPPPGDSPAGPGSGTEYMRERSERLRLWEEARDRFHRPLEELSRRSALSPAGAGSFKAAYLVERGRVGAFAATVARLGEANGARVSCTGPWPPYSFVSEAER